MNAILCRDFPAAPGLVVCARCCACTRAADAGRLLRSNGYTRNEAGALRPGEFAVKLTTKEHDRACVGCSVQANPLPGGWETLQGLLA